MKTSKEEDTQDQQAYKERVVGEGEGLKWKGGQAPTDFCSWMICSHGHKWWPELAIGGCPGCKAPLLAIKMALCPFCNEPPEEIELRVDLTTQTIGIPAACQGQEGKGEIFKISLLQGQEGEGKEK